MEEGGAGGEKASPQQRSHTPEHWLPAACVPGSSLWPFRALPTYLARAEVDQDLHWGVPVSPQGNHFPAALGKEQG